jgi:hypothetical protein
MAFKEKIQKLKCKLGLHKWNTMGWGGVQRFDICLAHSCGKTKWVDDEEGCRKVSEDSKYYHSRAGFRERRLDKVLNKLDILDKKLDEYIESENKK